MIRDGNETDADCGGDTCRPCGASQHCKIDSDCITDICNPNTKQCDVFTEIDQCSNQELDEGEACEDAGGPLCGAILGHACYVGQTCQHDSNCEAGNVCDTSTKQCASCFDQERNGDETDVDCGGKSSRCEACADGKKCDRNGDCVSNMCVRGTCSSCFNGIQDGDEIDVDCSGSCEKPCPLLAKCKNHTDCVTKQCTNGTCVSRSREIECESTCGGPRCRFLGILCLEGETCEKDQDCLTGLRCIEEKCTNCNTPESKFDVRCGPLGNGLWCEKDKDCRSGMCKGKGPTRLCSSCWNGILDGSEMAIDSGGDCEKKYSLKAGVGDTCWKDDDCATGFVMRPCKALRITTSHSRTSIAVLKHSRENARTESLMVRRRISRRRALMEEARFVVRLECCVTVVSLVRRTLIVTRERVTRRKKHVRHVKMVFEMVRRRMWTAVPGNVQNVRGVRGYYSLNVFQSFHTFMYRYNGKKV